MIIVIIVFYLIIVRVVLGSDLTSYSNFRIVERGGIFGGDSVSCDEDHRKPTGKDIFKAFIWPIRLILNFILTTLWLICECLFLSDSRFAKWLNRHT